MFSDSDEEDDDDDNDLDDDAIVEHKSVSHPGGVNRIRVSRDVAEPTHTLLTAIILSSQCPATPKS